jgi:tetratricopeptide (TPR) repeat protein
MQKRKWVTVLILFLGIIPFVAVSLMPLVSGITGNRQSATPSPSPSSAVSSSQKSQLQDEEKGYQAVLQREPENPTALEGLVLTRLKLVQAGHAQIAIVIDPLQKLSKLKPDRTDYLVLLAQAHQYSGNREAAAQAYNSVLATKPGDIKALQGMVSLMLQEQRPQAALGLLEAAIQKAPQANKLQPGSVDITAIQLLIGDIYTGQKRYSEAIALFDQLSAGNKNDFRPIVAKAMVFLQQGKNKEAEPLLEKAAALAPSQFKDQINQIALQAKASPPPAPEGQPTVPNASSPAVLPQASP